MKLKVQRNGIVVCECDLKRTSQNHWEIDYIRTLKEFRGKGYASQLLQRAKTIAIRSNTSLVAFIEPDGTGLTFEQETNWFIRNGFIKTEYDFGGYFKPVMKFN